MLPSDILVSPYGLSFLFLSNVSKGSSCRFESTTASMQHNSRTIQIIKPIFAPMHCFKIFYTLKPSTHIKIDFKNYSNMFRSRWTIIREYVVPIPKLPLITY